MGRQEKLFASDKEKARLEEILHKNNSTLAMSMKELDASMKYFKVFNDYAKMIRDETELLHENLTAGVESGKKMLKALRDAAEASSEVIECRAKLADLAAGGVVVAVVKDTQIVDEQLAEVDDEPLGLPEPDDSANEAYDLDASEAI